VLGLAAGTLTTGSAADICIFHPEQEWKVERRALKCQGKNSPWLGYDIAAACAPRWSSGHVVYELH